MRGSWVVLFWPRGAPDQYCSAVHLAHGTSVRVPDDRVSFTTGAFLTLECALLPSLPPGPAGMVCSTGDDVQVIVDHTDAGLGSGDTNNGRPFRRRGHRTAQGHVAILGDDFHILTVDGNR